MGHPWKKRLAKPGMTDQEFWGDFYPLFKDGTISRLVEIGKKRQRICRMKENHQKLLEKKRLLERKISEFR
jgi:hypothetical protein